MSSHIAKAWIRTDYALYRIEGISMRTKYNAIQIYNSGDTFLSMSYKNNSKLYNYYKHAHICKICVHILSKNFENQ